MYSASVIQRNIERVEQRVRAQRLRDGQPLNSDTRPFRLVRFDPSISERMSKELPIDDREKEGKFTRELTPTERAFIDNELMMTMLDFQYGCERYFVIQMASESDRPEGFDLADAEEEVGSAGPRLGKFILNGMQIQLMKKLARLEDLCYEALDRGAPINGILLILHKARQLGACLKEGTKVLTADLKWVPIETVKIGDRLLSCDEYTYGKGHGRKMQIAVVEATRSFEDEVLCITLADGRQLFATAPHRFLCRRRGAAAADWRTVSDMVVGDFIRNFGAPWGQPAYEDGWFAGMMDGEGCVRAKRHGGIELSVCQVPGDVLSRAAAYLQREGCFYRDEVDRRKGSEGSSKFGDKPVHKLVINQSETIFRLIGRCQPSRFTIRTDWWVDKELPNAQDLGGPWAQVVSIERYGTHKVYDLQTSTRTFIAEGVVSHNSVLWQALIFHRVNFYSHINALVASIDDPATEMLFRRFWRIHDNLPFWMRSKIASQGRYEGVRFERDSLVQLQSGKQQKDLGKGETWHAVHVTEASVFERPEDHFDEGLFAAIPNSLYTLYGMEGTSKGKRGWWYDFVTAVMSGSARGGAGRFSHYFAPFYLIDMADSSRGQRSKYRIEAPLDWQPNLSTQMMLRRVESTSHLFCDIERLILHRDVAYWYESTRKYFDERGKLHIFRQNYPVDPNESFQHAAGGAFTNETIERLDGNVAEHSDSVWPYELLTSAEASESSSLISSDDHPVYHRGDYTLQPIPRIEIESSADRDPRGIIWIYEHPADRWFYVLGSDPTGGIPGWRRQFKQSSDINTDNGAIEIFRKDRSPQPCEDCLGRGWKPTSERGVLVECAVCRGRGKTGGAAIQCCEFAGPIDAEELAPYIWFLGRLYRGSSEFEECLAVIENNNTGILTIRTLQSKFDYTNLWQSLSQGAEITPRFTNAVGFYSGPTSVPILHARSRSIVTRKDADIRSPHLVKEYSDAIVKITGSEADAASKSIVVRERFTVPPGGGRNDDRMSASFLCYMILFDISDSVDGQESAAPSPAAVLIPDLASRDATAEEQRERWNRAAAEYVDAESIQLGGHYADCEAWCQADHGRDGEDDFGFDSDELDEEEGEGY